MAYDENNFVSGEDIMGRLLDSNKVLFPLAISPYGRWGTIFHSLLFGKGQSYRTFKIRPGAESAPRSKIPLPGAKMSRPAKLSGADRRGALPAISSLSCQAQKPAPVNNIIILSHLLIINTIALMDQLNTPHPFVAHPNQ